jgi:hypothetical protein
MNAGAMIAIHAAAAAAKARTEVLDAFRRNGATAPERARSLYDLGLASDNHALRGFFEAGVLRGVDSRGREVLVGQESVSGDRYYLDEAAFIAQRDGGSFSTGQRRLLLISLGVGLLVIGLLILLALGRRA